MKKGKITSALATLFLLAILAALWVVQEEPYPTRPGVVPAQLFEDEAAQAAQEPASHEVDLQRRIAPELPTTAVPTFAGRVRDHFGAVVAGARIEVRGPEDSLQVEPLIVLETDHRGLFGLELQFLGELEQVFLSVSHPHFLTKGVTAAVSEPLELRLEALPTVRVTVVTPERLPAETAAQVELFGRATDGEEIHVTGPTDAAGAFLARLPPGRLSHIEARAKRYVPRGSEVDEELAPDGTSVFEIVLRTGAVVEGHVVDAVTRNGIPGARVFADTTEFDAGSVLPTTLSDESGFYRLVGVDTSHTVSSGQGLSVTLYVQAEVSGYAIPLSRTIVANWQRDGEYQIEIELWPASCSVEGIVLGTDGEPAAGVLVYAVNWLGAHDVVQTDGDGGYSIGELTPGPMSLYAWQKTGDGTGSYATEELELQSDKNRRVRLELESPRRGSIRGSVTDELGAPIRDHNIFARHFVDHEGGLRIELDGAGGVTDFFGNFVIEPLPPGVHVVSAQNDYVAGRWSWPRTRELRLEAEQRVDAVDFVMRDPIEFRGWVRPATGAALEDVTISLVDLNEEEPREQLRRPEDDGSFLFQRLGPGSYEIVLRRRERVLLRRSVGPASDSSLVLMLP